MPKRSVIIMEIIAGIVCAVAIVLIFWAAGA